MPCIRHAEIHGAGLSAHIRCDMPTHSEGLRNVSRAACENFSFGPPRLGRAPSRGRLWKSCG